MNIITLVREDGTKRVQKVFTKPSKTRQEFKNECDLSLVIKRFAKTHDGRLALQKAQGFVEGLVFDDVSAVPDYRTALDQVSRAKASFMALPAVLRKRFDNDPAVYLDFCTNPANLAEMRTLGLAKPEPVAPVAPQQPGNSG